MERETFHRRLTTILAADVVGYSRMMEANEERTLSALRQLRSEFFDITVTEHGGRIFKIMGDGFLVEFGSVVNAVRCALEIQQGMCDRNAAVSDDRQIRFRIGINVGDLIVEKDDFYGDVVNLAARLEGLARPGGIACSAAVHNQIVRKLQVRFVDQGNISVKNLVDPLHVYFIESPDTVAASDTLDGRKPHHYTDRPTVAVLPFSNLSDDPEQEFFSAGITEDIIIDLSKVGGLSVISRNAVFTVKGKSLNLQQTARQLGAAYLIQGTVRKSGSRVRITAQLLEGATDRHIWAERYDRELNDIFELQDEITQAIVKRLKVQLLPEEKRSLKKSQTNSADAYTAYLRGAELLRNRTKSSLLHSRQLFVRAIELDPNYARAYAGLANCATWLKTHHGASITVEEILSIVEKALAIDPKLADAHAARGAAMWIEDRREEAVTSFEQALSLDPESYQAHFHYGRFLETIGNFDLASKHYMRATEVQPDDYQAPLRLAEALVPLNQRELSNKYAKFGIKRCEEALLQHPENSRPAQLGAAALARLGENECARRWIARAIEIDPDDNHMRYNIACAYALMGDVGDALDLLEVWINGAAENLRLWLQSDPDLASIRDLPRFKELLDRAAE